MMSAMIMIFLLLIIFFIAMKIKEKLRLRQHLIRRNARILQNNQNNNNNHRRQLRQQDSLISYETAIQNKNSIIITQMIIDELNEFKLPTYDEALKTKNGPLNSVI